jgi:hypothetical protein
MDKNTMLALNDERNMRQLDKKAKKFSYSFFTTERRTNIKVNLPQQWYVDGRSSQKVDVKVECLVSNDYHKLNNNDDHPYLVYISGFSNFNNTTNSLISDNRPFFAIMRSIKSEHTGSNFYIDYRKYKLREGIFYKINNFRVHSVENNSTEDRIHLIVDILPYSNNINVKFTCE